MHALALVRWVGALVSRRPRVAHVQVTDTGIIRDVAYVALAGVCRTPVVSHVHSTGFFGVSTARRDRALRWIARHSDAVIVLSEALRARLSADLGSPRSERVAYLANPLPPLDEPAPLQTETGRRAFRILTVGEISADKGQPAVGRIVDELRAAGEDCILELVGPWGAVNRQDRDRLESSEAVELAGVLRGAEKTRAYDRADVFVLFSNREAQPLVLLEAMSRGLPVIATGTGGVPDMLAEATGNRIVPVGAVDALKTAITEFLRAAPAERARVGAQNRRFVEDRCGVPQHLSALVDMYRRVSAS